MEKIEYRIYIKFRVKLGIKLQDIWNELKNVSPASAPSYTCVAKWAKLFRDGRESFEDDPRVGPPQTSHSSQKA